MGIRLMVGALLAALILAPRAGAQLPEAPQAPLPDDRLKADILVVVAHPDDEILVIGYLARAGCDQHKRVAVVYATRGDHGSNRIGYEQAASLALERELEARRGLAGLGILNVWFLDAPNVAEPTEDPLGSLEKWSHGEVLERTVRLIRLTRPEVVITWLPDYVVGENHSDHQAAGILATEAFDLAGNPLVFAEQVTPPIDYRGYGNLKEGLHPWQPQKLYYFSDTSHGDFLSGAGPTYVTTDVSPARGVPYYRLSAEEISSYITQGEGIPAQRALAKGNLDEYHQPVQLIMGKSLVKSTSTGDVFEGVVPEAIPFAPARGYQDESHQGVSVELGSPWSFYRRFWPAHNIEHIAKLHAPELGFKAGPDSPYSVNLLIRNDTDEPKEITLTADLPAGWKELRGLARYPVRAHSVYPVEARLLAQHPTSAEWHVITWNVAVDGTRASSVSLRVFTAPSGKYFNLVDLPGPQ
jgi:LmbE family N-acetylglucosaminyl deacetylase